MRQGGSAGASTSAWSAGRAGHGEAVEAPATTSMPAHPGDAPTSAKEARALADELLERAEAARAEREAPALAALARARAGHS